jgi:putative addiction module component (TIGR02574 family)
MKTLGIDRLNVEERLALVTEIWDSIAASDESLTLSDDLKRTLSRRMTELDEQPDRAMTWEEIKQQLKGE